MTGKEKNSSIPISSLLKRNEVKVLVVEDDKFLREILGGKLTKEGYTVLEALDGDQGIEKTKSEQPHIILLDLVLPGADGYDVLGRLKQDPEVSKIPVIVLSNLGSREDIDRAIALGAQQFMVKAHHTPQEIIEAVKKILDEHYLQK
ncbi:MAG: response regulator [Patescibacteria group bacterium]